MSLTNHLKSRNTFNPFNERIKTELPSPKNSERGDHKNGEQ